MGRPKGSTNSAKRTQTAQQDMQQQAMEEITKRDYAQPVTDTTATATAEVARLQAERDAATAAKLSEPAKMTPKQRSDILALCHELKTTTSFKQRSIPESQVTYQMAEEEIKRLKNMRTTSVTKKAQGAVSKQTTSEMVASLWTKNTDDFPEDLNSLTKIDARKILGVPFICVGIEEKIGGPDSLNPGKPFWTMKLLFDGTGDEEFSCNVSGGYIANQIKKIASFVSYDHPLYRTFELVPEYITAEQRVQNPAYPAFWLKQWRSVRGEYDVTFAY